MATILLTDARKGDVRGTLFVNPERIVVANTRGTATSGGMSYCTELKFPSDPIQERSDIEVQEPVNDIVNRPGVRLLLLTDAETDRPVGLSPDIIDDCKILACNSTADYYKAWSADCGKQAGS